MPVHATAKVTDKQTHLTRDGVTTNCGKPCHEWPRWTVGGGGQDSRNPRARCKDCRKA